MYNLSVMVEQNTPPTNSEAPIAAIAYYGPDDQTATKVVVAIVDAQHNILEAQDWEVEAEDIRKNTDISHQISTFIGSREISRVVIAEKIVGCPHVPGIDYPAGEPCPFCPFWRDEED